MRRINCRGEPFQEFHHILWFQSTEYLELLYVTHVRLLIFAKGDVLDDGRTLKFENEVLEDKMKIKRDLLMIVILGAILT